MPVKGHRTVAPQSLDDPVIAPPFASFRDIRLQQDPRLQYPARQALSFPNQGFKPFAFLAAQPHNILLYRNLLRSHDCLPSPVVGDESESLNPFKLVEAGD